jgi:ubiquinone/menaquinone biosynthesis C-methylase UbiE
MQNLPEHVDIYADSAVYYDAIYAAINKNYDQEAQQINEIVQQYKRSAGNTLLDIGCGTGGHIPSLRQHYHLEGLDVSSAMLDVARQRHPDITFYQGDMISFDLDHQFDVITCLFSAIGYVETTRNLELALSTMSHHLHPGGVLIVEPWFALEEFHAGGIHTVFVDQPNLKIARMNISEVKDNLSILNFHYLVATPQGVNYFTENLILGLFSPAEYLAAFRQAGLEVIHDPQGLTGRGLYIGMRPLTSG